MAVSTGKLRKTIRDNATEITITNDVRYSDVSEKPHVQGGFWDVRKHVNPFGRVEGRQTMSQMLRRQLQRAVDSEDEDDGWVEDEPDRLPRKTITIMMQGVDRLSEILGQMKPGGSQTRALERMAREPFDKSNVM